MTVKKCFKNKLGSLMFLSALCIPFYSAADVIQVDYTSLTGTAFSDFEDLGLADDEVINYDGIFESGNTSFGESFAGQTVTQNGIFDTLSGLPSGPLTIAPGDTNDNIVAADGADGNTGNTSIIGLGPTGNPNPDAIGEGAIAILFDFDQSEFGFEIIGGNNGTATVQFFERNGSLFDEIVLNVGSGTTSWGFVTDDGAQAIAGVSIFNNDGGGIGFDNFIYDVEGIIGTPNTSVNTPATLSFLIAGICFVSLRRRLKS